MKPFIFFITLMRGSVLIRIKEIKKGFRNKPVLDNVNLDIKEKEIFGIIGASGAGKTTLLRLLIGFHQPDKGNILFKIKDNLRKRAMSSNREIGFATQDSSFYFNLTVHENLKYFAALHDIHEDIGGKISRVLGLVNLKGEENHLAKDLSDGMKKRLDLACALIHEPKILILDEPTANIDISLKRQIWALIKKINKCGTTIILSSHYLDEVEALCTRIAVIHNRKIAAVGTASELKKRFAVKRKQALDDVFENITSNRKK
jgi:ABC-2 type transport system ATP-binding protein